MVKDLTKVEFTNLDKILYPELKIKKAQVIEYYIRMAPKMLGILEQRPVVMTRFPDGIHGESFYEKDAPMGKPSWIETWRHYSETAQRDIDYVLCNNLDTLIWLANLAALEIHVTLSKVKSFENPDMVLFDLDPEPPASFSQVIDVALMLKEKLDALGLKSYPKTSGLKGLHVLVPIVEEYSHQQAREFAHQIAKQLEKESELVTSEYSRVRKPNTVRIDYRQNSHGRTMICPYSLRATPDATVSTPLEWRDINKQIRPEQLNLFSVVKIAESPWKDLLENRQRLKAT